MVGEQAEYFAGLHDRNCRSASATRSHCLRSRILIDIVADAIGFVVRSMSGLCGTPSATRQCPSSAPLRFRLT